MLHQLTCGSFVCSDSLIEEAASSESSAKSFRERDEKGFRESEVSSLNIVIGLALRV